jgi:hypothetical protein
MASEGKGNRPAQVPRARTFCSLAPASSHEYCLPPTCFATRSVQLQLRRYRQQHGEPSSQPPCHGSRQPPQSNLAKLPPELGRPPVFCLGRPNQRLVRLGDPPVCHWHGPGHIVSAPSTFLYLYLFFLFSFSFIFSLSFLFFSLLLFLSLCPSFREEEERHGNDSADCV